MDAEGRATQEQLPKDRMRGVGTPRFAVSAFYSTLTLILGYET